MSPSKGGTKYSSPSPSSAISFLDLPGEVRMMIYRYFFSLPGKPTRRIGQVERLPRESLCYKVSLLLVCRRVHKETIRMFYEESHFRLKLGSPKALDVPTWKAEDEAERMDKRNKKKEKNKDVNGRSWEGEDELFHGSSIRVDLWRLIHTLDIYVEEEPENDAAFRIWYLMNKRWLAFIAIDIFGDSPSLSDLTIASIPGRVEDTSFYIERREHMFDPLAYFFGVKKFTSDVPMSANYVNGLAKAVMSDYRRLKLPSRGPLEENTTSVHHDYLLLVKAYRCLVIIGCVGIPHTNYCMYHEFEPVLFPKNMHTLL